MKVPGNDGSNKKGLADAIDESKTGSVAAQRKGLLGKAVQSDTGKSSGADDSVKVSELAALMKQELNPATILSERREKVDRLKQLISQGQYKPDVQRVAASVSEELSLEILFGGQTGSTDDSLV